MTCMTETFKINLLYNNNNTILAREWWHTAAPLILSVLTVSLSVTAPPGGYAPNRLPIAGELWRQAFLLSWTRDVSLLGESLLNTDRNSERRAMTQLTTPVVIKYVWLTAGSRELVGSISAVVHPVTHPASCDAFLVAALKLLLVTCSSTCNTASRATLKGRFVIFQRSAVCKVNCNRSSYESFPSCYQPSAETINAF